MIQVGHTFVGKLSTHALFGVPCSSNRLWNSWLIVSFNVLWNSWLLDCRINSLIILNMENNCSFLVSVPHSLQCVYYTVHISGRGEFSLFGVLGECLLAVPDGIIIDNKSNRKKIINVSPKIKS